MTENSKECGNIINPNLSTISHSFGELFWWIIDKTVWLFSVQKQNIVLLPCRRLNLDKSDEQWPLTNTIDLVLIEISK